MKADIGNGDRGDARDPNLRRVALPLKSLHDRESLMSIVYRTAEESVVTPGNIILSAGYPHRQTFNMAVTDLERAPALAYVLQLPEAEVRSRTYPTVFPSALGCTFVDFAGASVPLILLNVRQRKVAAAALEQRPFHHLLSEHRLLPFDADTGAMLIANCPECEMPLRWTKVRSFLLCPCGADLRSAPPAFVPAAFLDGARMMANLLDPRPATHNAVVDALPTSLRPMNRGTIFEIGWQTAIAIGFAERPSTNAANWADDDKLRSLDLAAKLLSDWPASTERAFAALPSTERRRQTITKLAALARSTRVPDDVRVGIKAILPQRALSTRSASAGRPHGVNLADDERRRRREAYSATGCGSVIVGTVVDSSLSMNQASHILGKSIDDTSRMLRTLDPVETFGAHKTRTRYARDDVERLAELLQHREPIDAFSSGSGIPHHGIEQMICLKLLDQLDDPAILAGHKVRQLDGRSINALAERLAFGSLEVEPNGWLRLTDAMKAVGGREKPWGPAYAMMLDEKSLPFYWRSCGELGRIIAENIFVSPTARDRLREMDFCQADYPEFKFDDCLTVRDATRLLNIHDTKFSKIRLQHFATAVTADGRLAKRAVIAAARDWISPGELGARTGRTPHECFTELYRTDLPRTLLGWPRTDAERHMKLRASDR